MLERLAELQELITSTTIELIDCGGTIPWRTYEVLIEDHPDLINSFDKQDVLALCKKIQTSEIPGVSTTSRTLPNVQPTILCRPLATLRRAGSD
jgi:hypothetical protein